MPLPAIYIPLYIYPAPGAWQPLVDAATQHPDLTFVAVVNPNNGPGSDSLPDSCYVSALQQLATLANVQLLGYVHVTYGRRSARDVMADITTYAHWARESAKLHPDASAISTSGIFFDEVPSDATHAGYLNSLAAHTRAEIGPAASVVYNPGVVISRSLADRADKVVVFENKDDAWDRDGALNAIRGQFPTDSHKAVVMIHSCRRSNSDLAVLIGEVAAAGLGGVYLTDQLDGGYTRFPSIWDEQLELLAEYKIKSSGRNKNNGAALVEKADAGAETPSQPQPQERRPRKCGNCTIL